MQHSQQHDRTKSAAPQLEPACFKFTPDPAATSGRWRKEMDLPPVTREYRLVVDGQWLADALAGEATPNRWADPTCS